jgi:multiple sugar transport system substrate-binding protein
MNRVSRRTLLKASGAGALATTTGRLAGILATGIAPAVAQQKTVHWLRWNDFVPASDQVLRESLLPEAEKALGLKVNFERVNGNDLQPRITAAIQSGAGPDLIMLFNNHPHLYKASLADLSDVAEAVGKEQGGYYAISQSNCNADGRWVSMPFSIIGAMLAYRKSWFDEAGYTTFPKTWDEYRAAGKKLKAMGRPIGQTLGHSFGDPPTFSYPFLWSFGGKEVADDGKTVVINSAQTLESVKYMVGFWKDAHDEGGLAWDDSSNNRAFLSGTISATLNGASIYIESTRKPEQYRTEKDTPLAEDILHAPLPSGPAGQFAFHTFQSHVVPAYSRNQDAAKAFLAWLHTTQNYEKWFTSQRGFSTGITASWETHPMWGEDPVMAPYAVAGRLGQTPGYSGPASQKAAEVLSKYIITDMYAKAVQGESAEAVVAWCDNELKKIYAA